jgi:hypothetical protein
VHWHRRSQVAQLRWFSENACHQMKKLELSSTVPSKAGYSCQTLLAKMVNEVLHSGTYFCWFSEEFNADSGGNSSNPCWRYQTFDRAVRRNDTNDAYVRDAREKLVNALNLAVTAQYDLNSPPNDEDNAILAENILSIRHAGIELFRPQIWRIDLKKVEQRATSGHQYPHEHLIRNLTCQEFEVIVE